MSPFVSAALRTPCVLVCFVDDESGLCLGCFRTVDEVAAWTSLDDAGRAAIMDALPARRTQIDARKRGDA